jgi:hypothetical protein
MTELSEVIEKTLENLELIGISDFSLIQRDEIKQIAWGALKRSKEIESYEWAFPPYLEVSCIFIMNNFGYVIADSVDFAKLQKDRTKFIKERGYDGYREFFKKKQEEVHSG